MPTIAIQKPSSSFSTTTITYKYSPNILPCRINHTGPLTIPKRHWDPRKSSTTRTQQAQAKAQTQVNNTSTDTNTDTNTDTKDVYFRGRKLRGRVVKLPAGYKGPYHHRITTIHPTHSTEEEEEEEATRTSINTKTPPHTKKNPCLSVSLYKKKGKKNLTEKKTKGALLRKTNRTIVMNTHTDHTSLHTSLNNSDADSDAENVEDAGDRAFISPSEPHHHNVHDNNNDNNNSEPFRSSNGNGNGNTNTNTTPKEQEEVQIMEQIASFDAVTLWEHDALPHATENYFARGVAEWVSFAEAVSFFFLSAFFCREMVVVLGC